MTRPPKNDDADQRQIDEHVTDIYHPTGLGYPILERTNNALFWPEMPKGRIDLDDIYEVSTVPENPNTPMENIDLLQNKRIIP
ncbi:hypothetical protein ABG79_00345 [Caloramator mitchellensis]|uniref:Uncharacterized protein n=1 Tax=Caloramator mitchellensis TaxID=908809 RepID=A0A0R3JVG9_CALMK|nr:hypothetical protein [Caloramator mitchellensis]KRQ87544.1 hypothetical protein ABG79_00345 [Caloramator mitchellensis]